MSTTNSPLTISMITGEALSVLKNHLVLARYVNREYNKAFGVSGAKIGDTLNVRLPVQYVGGNGAAVTPENFVENSIPLQLDQQPHVALEFTSKDILLSIDDFSRRVLAPAVANIANQIDTLIAKQAQLIPSFVSLGIGVTPNTSAIVMQGKAKLNKQMAPFGDARYCVTDPDCEAAIVPALQGLLAPAPTIGKQYEEGKMGRALGFQWDMDQNIYVHTVGALGGTPAFASVAADGVTVTIDGCGASAVSKYFRKGDKITFAACNAVNGMSKVSTGALKQFTITADADSVVTTGVVTVTVSPKMVATGAYQNVDALPVDGALVSVWGVAAAGQSAIAGKASPQNLLFHRDAITLAVADLELPGGTHRAERASDPDTGISLRIIEDYVTLSDVRILRIDVLCGVKLIRPELAVVMAG